MAATNLLYKLLYLLRTLLLFSIKSISLNKYLFFSLNGLF